MIVVGSGIAGLQAALTAAVETEVLLISAGPVERTNSSRAQGGIAAAIGPDDTTELHEQDTYIAGRGLCRPSAVQILVRGAAARIQDLVDIGVPFEDDLGLEGGHSRNRIVHAGGAATGEHVAHALAAQVMAHPRIEIMTGIRVRGLWVEDGECIGVLSDAGAIAGRATILATGGAASFGRAPPMRPRRSGVASPPPTRPVRALPTWSSPSFTPPPSPARRCC